MKSKAIVTFFAILAPAFGSSSAAAQSIETINAQEAIFEDCYQNDCMPRGYGADYCTRLCRRAAGMSDNESSGGGDPNEYPIPGGPQRRCYGQQEPCNPYIRQE